MSFYPEITSLLASRQSGQDQPLLQVHRSLYSILNGVIWFLVSAVLVCYLDFNFPDARISETHPILKHLSVHWLIIIPIGILIEIIRRYHNDLYIFESDQVTHYHGRLAISYHVPVIKYQHIRAVRVVQGILGRIFNFGDVEIGTASEEGMEMVILGVRAPLELAGLIEEFRNIQNGENSSNLAKSPTSLN